MITEKDFEDGIELFKLCFPSHRPIFCLIPADQYGPNEWQMFHQRMRSVHVAYWDDKEWIPNPKFPHINVQKWAKEQRKAKTNA